MQRKIFLKETAMFAVFNWGPVYTSGGFCEHQSHELNKWVKQNPGVIVEHQDIKMVPTADGKLIFLTVVIRYSPPTKQ
jgi:hypothetical protein